MAQKYIVIGRKEMLISGLSEDDKYFKNLPKEYGQGLSQIAERYLTRDSCFWDIGANIGLTALALQSVCLNGKHLALEPNLQVYQCLQSNLTNNGIKNVHAVRGCAGPADGMAHFTERSAFGYVSKTGTEVRMLSAESLYKIAPSSEINFIKIDIEGFEFPFLQAAEKLLLERRPIIYTEFNSQCIILNFETSPHLFSKWLFDFFPHIYLISPPGSGVLKDIKRLGYHTYLHDQLVHRQSIDDLVLSFEPLL